MNGLENCLERRKTIKCLLASSYKESLELNKGSVNRKGVVTVEWLIYCECVSYVGGQDYS